MADLRYGMDGVIAARQWDGSVPWSAWNQYQYIGDRGAKNLYTIHNSLSILVEFLRYVCSWLIYDVVCHVSNLSPVLNQPRSSRTFWRLCLPWASSSTSFEVEVPLF
jgi:hypothetical protein